MMDWHRLLLSAAFIFNYINNYLITQNHRTTMASDTDNEDTISVTLAENTLLDARDEGEDEMMIGDNDCNAEVRGAVGRKTMASLNAKFQCH